MKNFSRIFIGVISLFAFDCRAEDAPAPITSFGKKLTRSEELKLKVYGMENTQTPEAPKSAQQRSETEGMQTTRSHADLTQTSESGKIPDEYFIDRNLWKLVREPTSERVYILGTDRSKHYTREELLSIASASGEEPKTEIRKAETANQNPTDIFTNGTGTSESSKLLDERLKKATTRGSLHGSTGKYLGNGVRQSSAPIGSGAYKFIK